MKLNFNEILNFLLDAILVIYKNKINIPLIIIKKIIYENQKFIEIYPEINEKIIVWVSKQVPIDIGWVINKIVNEVIIDKKIKIFISENSLY